MDKDKDSKVIPTSKLEDLEKIKINTNIGSLQLKKTKSYMYY